MSSRAGRATVSAARSGSSGGSIAARPPALAGKALVPERGPFSTDGTLMPGVIDLDAPRPSPAAGG
ncbi:hypothetical protein ACF08O_12715 [Streptomyces paradoxus]|uniref:hypothetical protein n=1 Tax=Streptomyces paradoxus TaxID=66375 RepID=UPI0036F66A10